MAQGPTGTVTLLFTDLERSTEMLQKLGDDEARALLRTHFRLLRDAVADRGGQEVKNLGDGLMVAFPSALDALACAVAMQQAVHRHNRDRDESERLQVRVGLHVGEPVRDEDDYFGLPVVLAKRLCDHAQGGQALVSDLVRRLVGSRGGYMFRDLGPLSLKGVSEPLSAYEVVWKPDVEEAAAPLPLPPWLTSVECGTFVGRERELEQLRFQWRSIREGQPQLVFVIGEPGIGKTRLAAEFARAAHAEGAAILFGRCDEGADLPYQPFLEALRHYVVTCPLNLLRAQLAGAAELAALVPELAQRLPDLPARAPGEPGEERHRLHSALVAALASVWRASPVVLVLDDLQWADASTLLLLKQIVRAPGKSPLMILGTYRETELTRRHPLSETLADLRRHGMFERIQLAGLDEDAVGRLIGAWAGQQAPPSFVEVISEQTEGNPFFIEEVLRHLAETGAIQQHQGRLITDSSASELSIPEGVKAVIGQRLSRLSKECNSVLTIASVIGREFGLDALRRASDLPDTRLLELLEEAVDARVVAEVPHIVGRYTFSHALIHEALYEELTTTRRVSLHGQTLQYADSNGVKLAFEVLGASGPYVIAIGLSNCPSVRSRIWSINRRWERVARHQRVILYDRRGVGFSAAPEGGYDFAFSVKDLLAVMDAAGVDLVVPWGATDGGPLAIAFAAQYPGRVSGLILTGTTPKLASWGDFRWGISPAVLQSFMHLDPLDQGEAASRLSRTRHYRSEDADAIGEVMRRVPRRAWSEILRALSTADARPLLAQVQAPTLIVHDPDNEYIPVEAAHYLHEHIADSRLEITDEYTAAHLGDTLLRDIETFISEVTARNPSQA